MKTVLIDAREADRNPSGIGVVAKRLADLLPALSGDGVRFVVARPGPSRRFDSKLGRLAEFLWWKTFRLAMAMLRHRAGLVVSLDPVPALLPVPRGAFVHDLIFLRNPEWVNHWGKFWSRIVPATIRGNRLILCNSQCTSDDVERFFPGIRAAVPTTVAPLGVDTSIFRPGREGAGATRWGVTGPYVVFVGNAEPRRNLWRVMSGIASLRRLGHQRTLVVVGNNARHAGEIQARARDLGIEESVILPGFVSDPELADLYCGADFYVYPSLFEGFGLTVLEAMSCGCPVITSRTSSLGEIAGDAALLVDPEDQSDLDQAMLQLTHDPERVRLRELGLRRAGEFGWDRCARIVEVAIRGVLR